MKGVQPFACPGYVAVSRALYTCFFRKNKEQRQRAETVLHSSFVVRHSSYSEETHVIRGILPALLTPLDGDAAVNHAALRRLIEFHIQSGVSGFFLCGGSGEGLLLS